MYKEEIDKRRKEKVDKRNEVTERTEVELLQEEQQKSDLSAEKHKKDTTKIPWSVVISGSSTGLPWYTPANSTYTTLSSARLANVNTYPEDSLNELAVARIKVFGDLWKKGYFMGSGLKFGGDFLVYPGARFMIAAALFKEWFQLTHVHFHRASRRSSSFPFSFYTHGLPDPTCRDQADRYCELGQTCDGC